MWLSDLLGELDPKVGDTVQWKDSTPDVNPYYFVLDKEASWNGYNHETNYKLASWENPDTHIWVRDFSLFDKVYDHWNEGCEHPSSAHSYVGIGSAGYYVCILCDSKLIWEIV